MDSKDPKNVLIIGQRSIITDGLIEIAINEAERGNAVWYLASKPVDKLPAIFFCKDRIILKRIMFTYCASLQGLLDKLMDLHNFYRSPSLLIVESLQEFHVDAECCLQGHAKTLAALHSCMDSFNERLKGPCWTVVSLDDNQGYNQESLATIIDLFYFKKNCVRAVDATFVRWFEEFRNKSEKRSDPLPIS